LQEAIARSASDLAALAASQTREAAAILEFQIAMLEDDDLHSPAFSEIDSGASAVRAWQRALDAQIADYAAAEDAYFRGRTADIIDLRDRVCRALAGEGRARLELTEEAILVADDLAPSRFLEIEPARLSGIALTAGSPSGHVAMLARARGLPMVVGLGSIRAVTGELALLDGASLFAETHVIDLAK
jgi:phosphoenolpyruvate-protein phosphotransferase (PTS system enzyme I)